MFDLESTLTKREIINELGKVAGKEAEIARITDEAMMGNLDFAEALRLRVKEFKGMTESQIKRVVDEVEFWDNCNYTLEELKKRGFVLVLLTGSFHEVTDYLKAGNSPVSRFDFIFANNLMLENGVATGDVKITVGSAGKERVLLEMQKKFGIPKTRTLAVGDGANDVPMFLHAKASIAFNGRPIARKAAKFSLEGEDFSQILEVVDREFGRLEGLQQV